MISVMIPTFNDEDTLEMCLASFAGLANELCVVDDCSEDSTLDILRQFAKNAPYRLVWEQNDRRRGWVENRQRLLGMATHDVLLSTDSDCVLRESCIGDLLRMAESLPPKWGYSLPVIALVGDVFHTDHRVIEGPDPNHSIWRKGGRERWFTNPIFSEEYLEDVAFADEYPGQPPLFHLMSVKSDLRIVQRHYARQWFAATGGKEPFIPWLIEEAGITEDEFPAWVKHWALEICKCGGIQRYDPQKWYPYPAVMQEELTNPRYRFIYEGDQIVGRERVTFNGMAK